MFRPIHAGEKWENTLMLNDRFIYFEGKDNDFLLVEPIEDFPKTFHVVKSFKACEDVLYYEV